jgi:hypothetical protein
MLEFILEPGKTLPFIGASANEAEVLLKPGNIYRFIKRYKVQYTRQGFTGSQDMLIYVYQFLLMNDENISLPRTDEAFDFSSHPDWSVGINAFKDAFSDLAGVARVNTATHDISSLSQNSGGSKYKTKKRKQCKSKRRSNKKRRTNKNKRKTKRRRI